MALAPPILTAVDPAEDSEASIDPFATQAGYERLAERIYPYVTVRMARPRFITSIAAAALVCQPFQDELAADGVSPPHLVFEWYVAEGFVLRRSEFSEEEWRRFPGSTKVERALRDGRRVSSTSYLKTPKVFGFTGVHKRLAVGLEIVDDDVALDEGGLELLRTWEDEQGLVGFVSGDKGPGAVFREDLRTAVKKGLAAAKTQEWSSKTLCDRVAKHLRFDRPGPRESRWLFERLLRTDYRTSGRDPEAALMRRELLERVVKGGRLLEPEDEQAFFRATAKSCSAALRERLEAIDVYEAVCRPLEDALRLVLHLSTVRGPAPISAKEFSGCPLSGELTTKLTRAIERAKESKTLLEWEPGVQDFIMRYESIKTSQQLFDAVLQHHEEAQRGKPPDGRRPWMVRASDGRVEARPQYSLNEPPGGLNTYVHSYRTGTVARFLRDLGCLPA